MDYQNDLHKALNNIFFKGLKTHIENRLNKEWGDDWKKSIREYSDNFRPPLDFDKNNNPEWDISKLIRVFTINELRDIFGIENAKQKNVAFVIRDTRNELAHNSLISLENLISALYGMKLISSIFDDENCLNNLNEFSKKFVIKPIDGNGKSTANDKEPKRPIPAPSSSGFSNIDELPIDWEKKSVGPIRLIEVSEKLRGQKKAIILRFDGIDIDVGCNFENGYSERLQKCKGLINQDVVVNWSGEKFTFEKGWFNEINSHQTLDKNTINSNSSMSNLNNYHTLFKIEKVERVPGSSFTDVRWNNPMWLIKTDKGEFINSVKDINENEIIPGSTVKGRISISKGYKWLNLEKTK